MAPPGSPAGPIGDLTMPPREPSRPTPKMVRLYHEFSRRLGGEPEDLWVYDPAELDDPPPFLTLKHVMVWPADEGCDVTTFITLGMADRRMTGADYFAELHLAVRADLPKDDRERLARYLTNVTEYPFQHGLKLDWWETIGNPGPIPFFPNCQYLLIRDRLAPKGFDTVDDPEGPVKLLYVVPLTPLERHLSRDHGRADLEAYWARGVDPLDPGRADPPPAPPKKPKNRRRPG